MCSLVMSHYPRDHLMTSLLLLIKLLSIINYFHCIFRYRIVGIDSFLGVPGFLDRKLSTRFLTVCFGNRSLLPF